MSPQESASVCRLVGAAGSCGRMTAHPEVDLGHRFVNRHYFRIADQAGTTPFADTSAFVDTN